MAISGGSGSSGNTETYIVPQSRPILSPIRDYSPITTGQTFQKEHAEALGLESWADYSRRMETQRAAVKTYSDTSGNIHVVEDYSKQGGGKYDTIISGPATEPERGWSGSGFNWRREQLLEQKAVGEALKRSGLEGRLIREGRLSGYEVNGKYFREESEAKNYIKDLERLERQHNDFSKTPLLTAAMQRSSFDYEYILPKSAQKGEVYAPRFGKMVSREEFYEKHPTPIMKAGAAFEKYETQVARKLNLQTKVIEPLEEWYGTSKKGLARMGFVSEPKSERRTEEFISGAGYGVANKPLTTAGNVAFALLVSKGAGALVSKVPAIAAGVGAGKMARNINAVNILGAGLAVAYGIDVSGRVLSAASPFREAGKIAATEIIPFAMGGYLGMKPLPKPSIPSVKLKFYETNKPVSVPGMGVFFKKRLEAKIILESPTSIKAETVKASTASNFYKMQGLKSTPISKTAPLIDLTQEPVMLKSTAKALNIAHRQGTKYLISGRSQSQRAITHQLEKAKTSVLVKSQAEKAIQKAVQDLGLKRKTASISIAASILGATTITAQKANEQSVTRQVYVQEAKTQQFTKAITEFAAISKQRTDLTPESFLTQVSKSVIAQKQVTREEPKQKVKEPVRIKTTERYPERKVFPQLKPKTFLSEVDKHKRRKGKEKYKWDIENPVPDLKSLGFE